MENTIKKFLEAFNGYQLAYGQHGNFKAKDNGKMEGHAQTVLGTVTSEIVERHLTGAGNGLGVVPLRQDNTVMFGAVDIDITGVGALAHTIEELENKINVLGLPFIPCNTKSGGVHLYCFTTKPVPSELMVRRLKEWASLLGYGSSEIFPKQTERANEQDIGNWINLPYYDAKDTKRYAINKGKKIDIEKFFELVDIMRISEDELNNFKMEDMNEDYKDAPPCLQILESVGVEDGSRNNGMYNFAVYLKKKNENTWQELIKDLNIKIVKPSLTEKELEAVIKSVNKRDFFYKCKEYPICQYCNKSECRKRKHGIASSEGNRLQLENLAKYISGEEIVWFAEYQGKRIQLTTDELLNQAQLQKRLVEAVNKAFTPEKPNLWLNTINALLTTCTIVHEPVQASRKGQFYELIDSFLTESASGETKDDLLKYNTFTDPESKLVYFRSFNLFTFLKNKRFKCSEQEVWIWLKDKKAKSQKMRVAKKSLNIWSMPAPDKFQFDSGDDEDKI